MTEQLTDAERAALAATDQTTLQGRSGAKALRIIDAHAADRAALVAQLEAAELRATKCEEHFEYHRTEEPHALEAALRRATDAESHAASLAQDLAELKQRITTRSCSVQGCACGGIMPYSGHHPAPVLVPNNALVAQVAELTRERNEAREGDGYWHAAAVAEGKAKLRAEGELRSQERATQQLSAEVTRLTEALAAAEQQAVRIEEKASSHFARADTAESECAALRAEVERLTCIPCDADKCAAESSLADANALVKHSRDWDGPYKNDEAFYEARDAHLAAQPATAPECNYVGRCNSSRCPKHAQPATAPWRCQKCTGDHAASERCQPATVPVSCTACQKRECDGTHVGCPSYLLDNPPTTQARIEAEQRGCVHFDRMRGMVCDECRGLKP